VQKYWTALKAAKLKNTARHVEVKVAFFHVLGGMRADLPSFSRRPTQYPKTGRSRTEKISSKIYRGAFMFWK